MDAIKPGSKYFPLFKHLQTRRERSLVLTFREIEKLLGVSLPNSARTSKAYWSNRSKGALQAKSWMKAGYHVASVDFNMEEVVFAEAVISYEVKREGDTILWNGAMVRSLRNYLDLNQAEFSEVLGVRQQTVSEWENQIYKPTRSRSKHLSLVAERAGYKFTSLEAEQSQKKEVDKTIGTVYNVNGRD